MNKIILILIISLFSTGCLAINPPIWPAVFSQSMTVNFGFYNTTGKFWYDYNAGGQRYDYQNGKSQSACGLISTQNTSCVFLIKRDKLYLILPQKNLCCYSVGDYIYPRNWVELGEFKYIGQRPIDQQSFYAWQQTNSQQPYIYYTDKSQKTIPRRFNAGQDFTMDFWINTYSQAPISSNVFTVPSFCTKSCNELTKGNNLQKQKLVVQ